MSTSDSRIDFQIDYDTGTARYTPEALARRLRDYVKDLGANVPTLRSTALTELVARPNFGIFTYTGTPLALRAHIRTALIHNIAVTHKLAFPTWRAIGVDALLKNLLRPDAENSEPLDHDILFIMSPEPHPSEKIQEILWRLFTGRSVEGQTTILCTEGTLEWFTGKAYSQAFHALVDKAKEASEPAIAENMVRSWADRSIDDL